MAGPHCARRDPYASIIHISFLTTIGAVRSADRHLAAVVGGVDDEGVVQLARGFETIEDPADSGVHMFDQSDVAYALIGGIGLSFSNAIDPFVWWLDGGMRCVVGEGEEKGLVLLCSVLDMVDRPLGEQIRGVAFRMDLGGIELHIIDAVAQMGEVIVHHIAEEAFEVVESSVTGVAVAIESQMPLADQGRVIARLFENRRKDDG